LNSPLLGFSQRVGKREVAGGAFASEEGEGIMYCAISGVTPDDPVVSRQSGLLYERRLILKHLEEHGTDPVTGDTMSLDDLISVKTNKVWTGIVDF
jgi:hypothetical protein